MVPSFSIMQGFSKNHNVFILMLNVRRISAKNMRGLVRKQQTIKSQHSITGAFSKTGLL